jgi:hypothetical protein
MLVFSPSSVTDAIHYVRLVKKPYYADSLKGRITRSGSSQVKTPEPIAKTLKGKDNQPFCMTTRKKGEGAGTRLGDISTVL